jgi:hypothetical protein
MQIPKVQTEKKRQADDDLCGVSDLASSNQSSQKQFKTAREGHAKNDEDTLERKESVLHEVISWPIRTTMSRRPVANLVTVLP